MCDHSTKYMTTVRGVYGQDVVCGTVLYGLSDKVYCTEWYFGQGVLYCMVRYHTDSYNLFCVSDVLLRCWWLGGCGLWLLLHCCGVVDCDETLEI